MDVALARIAINLIYTRANWANRFVARGTAALASAEIYSRGMNIPTACHLANAPTRSFDGNLLFDFARFFPNESISEMLKDGV